MEWEEGASLSVGLEGIMLDGSGQNPGLLQAKQAFQSVELSL